MGYECGNGLLLRARSSYSGSTLVGFRLGREIDKDGDGKLSFAEVVELVYNTLVVGFAVVFCLELYVFANPYFATTVSILVGMALVGTIVLLKLGAK